jgi:hypothetical protein
MIRYGTLLAATLALVATAPSAMAQTTTTIETTTVSSSGFSLPAGSYMIVDPLTGRISGDYSASVRVPIGYYVAEKSTGRVVATTDAGGNLIAFSTAPASQVLLQIQERRSALEQQIADALARKVVAVTEVQPLQSALQEIAAQEVVLRQNNGTVTYAQAAPLAYRLNVIGTQLAPVIKTNVAYSPILGERVFVRNGQVLVATTDYAARRALIDQRIQAEYDSGRLTNDQVKELRAELGKIANLELKKKRDGTLSTSNQRSIEKRFNELSADMQEDIAGTNKRRARIGLKVD